MKIGGQDVAGTFQIFITTPEVSCKVKASPIKKKKGKTKEKNIRLSVALFTITITKNDYKKKTNHVFRIYLFVQKK